MCRLYRRYDGCLVMIDDGHVMFLQGWNFSSMNIDECHSSLRQCVFAFFLIGRCQRVSTLQRRRGLLGFAGFQSITSSVCMYVHVCVGTGTVHQYIRLQCTVRIEEWQRARFNVSTLLARTNGVKRLNC